MTVSFNIVEQLIGPGVSHNGHKLNMKYPEFGSPVEWHQDWAFYPYTNDDLLAVGVAIDDMSLENGCLMVIPGSHKGPTYDHHQNGIFVGAVTDPNFSSDNAVPVQVKAGGISIHHVRTLHGSAPNTSSNPRRLLLLQYCAIDAWPHTWWGLECFQILRAAWRTHESAACGFHSCSYSSTVFGPNGIDLRGANASRQSHLCGEESQINSGIHQKDEK